MEVAGAQRILFSLASYFHAHGYPVQAAFFYDKQHLATEWQEQHPYPVLSLGGWKRGGFVLANLFRLLAGLFRLYMHLRRTNVVIAYTPHSNLLALPLAWVAGVKVRLGTHHGHIENSPRLLGWLHGKLTNSGLCTRMICVSSQVRTLAMREEGARASKLVVIDNGIHPPQQQSLSPQARQQLRASLDVKPEQTLFLTVGRLMVQKGHTYLLDAIAQLASRNFVFAFVGHGPLEQELRQQAQRLQIDDNLRFVGVRSDVGQLLEAADVFVQPSLWEGMSLALLEAMFAGLPIVATNIEAATDVLEHERSALLVTPRDPNDLASALMRIAADPALRERLGRAAKADAQQKYTVDVMGSAYAQLIENLWHD
ncbi:MAG TPA: glycosyltransferase [Anaerolineales bacterium]|nr:glycosyltransferase [Anaerolineales bacterium]HRQ92522.1 glycosyltransferase [Anaerolineales bacterium]